MNAIHALIVARLAAAGRAVHSGGFGTFGLARCGPLKRLGTRTLTGRTNYAQRPGVQLEEYITCFRQQRPTRIPPAGGRFCLLLSCPLLPGGQRHQPARSHHSGAPGARLPATRISIRQVHCRTSPAPGYAHVRNLPGSLRRSTAHARLPGARVGYGPDLAGPARPALPSGARTTMEVPELDSDWTGGESTTAPTTIT